MARTAPGSMATVPCIFNVEKQYDGLTCVCSRQAWLRIITAFIGVGIAAWFVLIVYYLTTAWLSLAQKPYSQYRLPNLIIRLQVWSSHACAPDVMQYYLTAACADTGVKRAGENVIACICIHIHHHSGVLVHTRKLMCLIYIHMVRAPFGSGALEDLRSARRS